MQYMAIDELGEIRKRRGIAYYHQLYTLLSNALNDGSIPAGSALPSESHLMQRFDVSRNTVRRALGQLEQEKRIIRRRGSGSYARLLPHTEASLDSMAEVLHDFDVSKAGSTSRLLRVQSVKTPEFIRRQDSDFGTMSLLVQRCRSFKNDPVMFSTSFVPEHLGKQLTRRALGRSVVLSALQALGVAPSTADQTTTAVLADVFTARHLNVEPGSALVCIHRLVKDRTGRSIEHQSHLYRADLSHLSAPVVIEKSSAGLFWSIAKSPRLPVGL